MTSYIFNLPDLGEGLPDAEICQWHVKEGDLVQADQLLVSMETAKAVVDVPSPYSGTVTKLFGKAGDIIKTGSALIEFCAEETAKKAKTKKETSQTSCTNTEKPNHDAGTVVGAMEISDEVILESAMGIEIRHHEKSSTKALPAVRVLAKQLNVELSSVSATGPKGEITAEDVKRAALVGQVISNSSHISNMNNITSSLVETIEPLRGVRRAMASAMALSHTEVVPVTIVDDADISAWPKGTDITVRVVRALCNACKAEPGLNAHFLKESQEIKRFGQVNLGIAMDSKDGLFVPVIQGADLLPASSIRQLINRFKHQVTERTIPAEDLKGSTIQLSNFGTFAGRYANPIIVPPIVAILGTGKIRDEVVAVNGAIAIHKVLPLSLSIDHRAVTGGEAARFLAAVIRDLQEMQ